MDANDNSKGWETKEGAVSGQNRKLLQPGKAARKMIQSFSFSYNSSIPFQYMSSPFPLFLLLA